ncbi:hypothetical protein GCM10010271_43480 [Streptomyces kurssanovii]|nr:hypothetical protein GCM10010271_43480 [Streptomyces kurssanovii]
MADVHILCRVTAVAMSGGGKLLTDFMVKAQDFRTAVTPPKNKGGSWGAGQGPLAATGARTTDPCKDLAERLPATFVYASIIVTDTLFSGTRGCACTGVSTRSPQGNAARGGGRWSV